MRLHKQRNQNLEFGNETEPKSVGVVSQTNWFDGAENYGKLLFSPDFPVEPWDPPGMTCLKHGRGTIKDLSVSIGSRVTIYSFA